MIHCPSCNEERPKIDFYSSGLGRRRNICSTCFHAIRRKRMPGESGALTPEERAEHAAIINAFSLWFGPVDRSAPLTWRT